MRGPLAAKSCCGRAHRVLFSSSPWPCRGGAFLSCIWHVAFRGNTAYQKRVCLGRTAHDVAVSKSAVQEEEEEEEGENQL